MMIVVIIKADAANDSRRRWFVVNVVHSITIKTTNRIILVKVEIFRCKKKLFFLGDPISQRHAKHCTVKKVGIEVLMANAQTTLPQCQYVRGPEPGQSGLKRDLTFGWQFLFDNNDKQNRVTRTQTKNANDVLRVSEPG